MRLLSLLDKEKGEEENQREIAMENRLQEAAMKGSVQSLLELLQEDPQILSKKTAPSLSDTPLHIAALLGHSAFAKKVLAWKPELAAELNTHGSSPLHLAAAKGSVEIVKDLILVNPDMCLVWDLEGRTPLHLAAIKGRVGVLDELIRIRPEASRVFTNWGDSCLHLCVKYNKFEALKVLVACIGGDDEFVNWRDSDGNTVLHVAVSHKQLEVKFNLLFFK